MIEMLVKSADKNLEAKAAMTQMLLDSRLFIALGCSGQIRNKVAAIEAIFIILLFHVSFLRRRNR